MCVVRALFASEIALGVAPTASRRRRLAAGLRHKTLHAGPGLNGRNDQAQLIAPLESNVLATVTLHSRQRKMQYAHFGKELVCAGLRGWCQIQVAFPRLIDHFV
jgi:hypothetical protein